ncbi:hypothetical protein ONZ51_g800 [Trametes cubensis]|uniref:Uncharacterized protein n=1 Tax=Trametes cubensis TaxID=1111947 RepID=A0AAD7XIA3_9APHY|nr:hypothetical protein ONZ51_g800 [Trametes cubensis]
MFELMVCGESPPQGAKIPYFVSQLQTFGVNRYSKQTAFEYVRWPTLTLCVSSESFRSSAIAIITTEHIQTTTAAVLQMSQNSSFTSTSAQTTSRASTGSVIKTTTPYLTVESPGASPSVTSVELAKNSSSSILRTTATRSQPARGNTSGPTAAALLPHMRTAIPAGTIVGIVVAIMTCGPASTQVDEDGSGDPRRRNARSTDKFPFLPAPQTSELSFTSLLRRFRAPKTSEALQNRSSATFDPNAMVRQDNRGVSSLRTSSYTEPLPEYGAWDRKSFTTRSAEADTSSADFDFGSESDTHTSEREREKPLSGCDRATHKRRPDPVSPAEGGLLRLLRRVL